MPLVRLLASLDSHPSVTDGCQDWQPNTFVCKWYVCHACTVVSFAKEFWKILIAIFSCQIYYEASVQAFL